MAGRRASGDGPGAHAAPGPPSDAAAAEPEPFSDAAAEQVAGADAQLFADDIHAGKLQRGV